MYSKPIEIKPLEPYKIWIKFEDNLEGIIDLNFLAKQGIFNKWDENSLFNNVYINSETFSIAWDDELELCPNTLYMNLKSN